MNHRKAERTGFLVCSVLRKQQHGSMPIHLKINLRDELLTEEGIYSSYLEKGIPETHKNRR
jgi:hypothetical protein